MRPMTGVVLEVVALAGVLALAPHVPAGPAFALYVLIAEFAATFLIHCPAHYFTGLGLGIGFTEMRLGRSTLARVLPRRLARVTRILPILTLAAERQSLARSSNGKAAAMYASGTVASVSAAFVIAGTATLAEPILYASFAWALALIYLAFDLRFSPRSGDLSRAMAARRRRVT